MYLYSLSVGLSFTQITVLEATYNLTTVLGKVPTGYVGDRVGRRNNLLVGTTLIALTLVGIGLAGSFPALVGCTSAGRWSKLRSDSADAWLTTPSPRTSRPERSQPFDVRAPPIPMP